MFKTSRIRTINHRPHLQHLQGYMVSRGHLRTHTLIEKRRARSYRSCGLALAHRSVFHIVY